MVGFSKGAVGGGSGLGRSAAEGLVGSRFALPISTSSTVVPSIFSLSIRVLSMLVHSSAFLPLSIVSLFALKPIWHTSRKAFDFSSPAGSKNLRASQDLLMPDAVNVPDARMAACVADGSFMLKET